MGLKNISCEVVGDSTGWRRARVLKRSDGKAQVTTAWPLQLRSFFWCLSVIGECFCMALWYVFALIARPHSKTTRWPFGMVLLSSPGSTPKLHDLSIVKN